jgi:hypothetical protein
LPKKISAPVTSRRKRAISSGRRKSYERPTFEIAALLGAKELLGAAHDGNLQARAVCLLLQSDAIPLADHAADCRRIIVAAKKGERLAPPPGIDVHEQDSSIVARQVHVGGHERVLRVGGITRSVAVRQLPFLVVERTQPMQGLAEVDREILALAAAEAPDAATDTGFAISASAAIVANGSGLGSRPTSRSTLASSRIGSMASRR